MRISLYYPYALVELVSYRQTEDHDRTGEVLLMFEDAGHCHVTIRLERRALRTLARFISSDPDPPALPE